LLLSPILKLRFDTSFSLGLFLGSCISCLSERENGPLTPLIFSITLAHLKKKYFTQHVGFITLRIVEYAKALDIQKLSLGQAQH
jgi:hypothetical protein